MHQPEGQLSRFRAKLRNHLWLNCASQDGRAKVLPFPLLGKSFAWSDIGSNRHLWCSPSCLIVLLTILIGCQDFAGAYAEESQSPVVPRRTAKSKTNNNALAAEKVELGEMLYFNANPKAAEKAFNQAVALDPDLYQAHFDLASLYQQLGNLEGAISQYREIVRLHNKERDAYFTLGMLLKDHGDLKEAIVNLETALALPSKVQETDTENMLAFTLISDEKPSEALSHFDHLLDSGEKAKQPDWILGKAMALYKLNKVAEASAEIDHALSLRPNYPAAHNLKGDFLSSSGSKDEAIKEYSKSIQDDPLFYQGYLSLGNLYLKDKQFALARDIFLKGEKIKPDDKNILYGLAYALENCGDLKTAVEKYQTVLAIEKNPSERATIEAHLRELNGR